MAELRWLKFGEDPLEDGDGHTAEKPSTQDEPCSSGQQGSDDEDTFYPEEHLEYTESISTEAAFVLSQLENHDVEMDGESDSTSWGAQLEARMTGSPDMSGATLTPDCREIGATLPKKKSLVSFSMSLTLLDHLQ